MLSARCAVGECLRQEQRLHLAFVAEEQEYYQKLLCALLKKVLSCKKIDLDPLHVAMEESLCSLRLGKCVTDTLHQPSRDTGNHRRRAISVDCYNQSIRHCRSNLLIAPFGLDASQPFRLTGEGDRGSTQGEYRLQQRDCH